MIFNENQKNQMKGEKQKDIRTPKIYLSNYCLWSSYYVLSLDDLKMNKIPLEAHSLRGEDGYKLLWYNRSTY